MKKSYKCSSEILMGLAQDKNLDGEVTYQDLICALGDRAFGIVILFFSLPTLLPLSAVPGVAFAFSLPIVVFSIQMICKRKSLWLPQQIARKSISHKKISTIIYAAVPYVVRLERFLKPRWMWMTSYIMEIINGITILFLSIFLMLPIPLSNFIFGGIIILFSLGITEKDGVFVFFGYFFFVLYLVFIWLLTMTAIKLY